MQKFRSYVYAVLFLLLPLGAFAEAADIHVTSQSPQFRITEPSNGTTGYVWKMDYDKNLLSLTSEKTYVPNSKLMGAGGKTIWVFTAKPQAFVKPKTQTMLKLVYQRPWNPKDNPKEMFIVVEFSS